MIAAESKLEARLVDQAFARGRCADSHAEAPEKILCQLEVSSRQDLMHLFVDGKERRQRP